MIQILKKNLYINIAVFILFVFCNNGFCDDWSELKGKHFIIEYLKTDDVDFARKVLNQAELYYQKIAKNIGYTRYKDFWTWDERTKIVIRHRTWKGKYSIILFHLKEQAFARAKQRMFEKRVNRISKVSSVFNRFKEIISFPN